MTERSKGAWVAFNRDIRDDDIEPTLTALRQIKGVVGVTLETTESSDWMARERVRSELEPKLWEAFNSVFRPERKK